MGGSSSKQGTATSQSQSFQSLPLNRSSALNSSVNNRPNVARDLHTTARREANQSNLPSRPEVAVPAAYSSQRLIPQPAVMQKSNSAAPDLIPRRLPPLQSPTNSMYHSIAAPVRVNEKLATPKPPEPKCRAPVVPLQTFNYPALTESMVQQHVPLATPPSTSSMIQTKTASEIVDDVQRFLNVNGIGSATPVRQVKRLQNSQGAGATVRRAGSISENSASPAVTSAGRKTTRTAGKMPPINQGNFLFPWDKY